MLLSSALIFPLGLLSEIWFLRDYWHRHTITGYPISIEDAIFAFALGGITFSIYKTLFGYRIRKSQTRPRRTWLMFVFGGLLLGCLLFLTNLSGVNSIFSSSLAFVTFAVLVWTLRPDLVKPSLATGFLSAALFLAVYQIMEAIFPGVLLSWCKACNPSNVRFLDVNIEELIWDFSWGLVGGTLYEAVTGREFYLTRPAEQRQRHGLSSNGAQAEGSQTAFAQFMSVSHRHVLTIRIVTEIRERLRSLTKSEISLHVVFVFISTSIVIVNILARPFGFSCSGEAELWLVYYVPLNYFLLWFPHIAWRDLVKASVRIDEVLPAGGEKPSLIFWINRRLQLRIQIWLATLGAVAAWGALEFARSFISERVEICSASHASVAVTAALGINAVYWLWNVPLLIARLHSFPRLSVTWHAPFRTPAIRDLSRLLGKSAILAAIGVVLFEIPLLYLLLFSPTTYVVRSINVAAFIASFGTLFFVTVFPQYWLSSIARKEKTAILDELSREIEDIRMHATTSPHFLTTLQTKMNIYRDIELTGGTIIDKQTIMNYVLAAITALLPYLVQWLASFTK